MKVSDLCNMIEQTLRSGRYPLETEVQRRFAGMLQVINRSDSDDLNGVEIKVETRVHDLYILNNYIQNIQHLPGVIELDVVDSFKIICRKLERLETGTSLKR